MPYFDLSKLEDFAHLLQLFLAAHPGHRQTNDTIRTDLDMPDQYFLSVELSREVAHWARQRHLITRQAATRLVEVATAMLAESDPASVVSLTPRCIGNPPRRQPTVLNTEILHWLTFGSSEVKAGLEAEAGLEVTAFTVKAAIQHLHSLAEDEELEGVTQARTRQLIAWLETQT